jgi:hypothetical protein
MKKKMKVYDLGLIPFIVRTREDCKKVGELVQKIALEAIKNAIL